MECTADTHTHRLECFELSLFDVALVKGAVELGTDLGAGRFGNQQESSEIAVGMAFEAFGNVGGDGDACTANLIAQRIITGKR